MSWIDAAEDEDETDRMESSAVRKCTPMLHVGANEVGRGRVRVVRRASIRVARKWWCGTSYVSQAP